MKSSMFGLRLSQFGKIQSFDFLKLIFRSLGSRWFNRQLCLFRIECRVDGLLGLHCIKDSEECNKDWITNNQYWSNWNKIWIRLDYEDGRNRRNLLEQSREPTTNSTHIWRRRCGIWTPGEGRVLPYKGLMGTCGQPGYVFRDSCLKQGIEFIIFCLKQDIFSWTINSKIFTSSNVN